jgi:hypothetical protein
MEAEETSQKEYFNEVLTTRENKEILFQESMRDEWADVIAESVGQVLFDKPQGRRCTRPHEIIRPVLLSFHL